MLRRQTRALVKRDFDAWGYNMFWPQEKAYLPLLGFASLTVEDIKFAYNAWCLLRLAMFYGTEHPKILSSLTNTIPSMNIAYGGNRLFYMHAQVEAKLSKRKMKVALTPCHPMAQVLQEFPWCKAKESKDMKEGVEIILGMENGLSQAVIEQSDYCLYIPQYGSIGSLSMLSALAIAIHSAHCAYHLPSVKCLNPPLPSKGHMPLSNNNSQDSEGEKPLPHERNFLRLSNSEIENVLEVRRSQYPLQLSIMIYNEFGDRNIGAIMRNANAFNCERMVIINRRRFNRRGAVGTQRLLRTDFHANVSEKEFHSNLDGYVVWLLYQYYPYLLIHGSQSSSTDATFIRPDNDDLQQWLGHGHRLTSGHPMINAIDGKDLKGTEIYLDNFESVRSAVERVAAEGYRGIMLAVPEEGASPHPDLVQLAQRVVFLVHPNHLPTAVQRGLNGALSSAIALERLRTAIDTLQIVL